MAEVRAHGYPVEGSEVVLTGPALDFLAELHVRFAGTRRDLLAARAARRQAISASRTLDFLPETADIRSGDWSVAPAPAALRDRRVEMTGPAERKMTINALNSGARVWLADLEDASTPHWHNVIGGQVNLYDAIRETITFTSPEGKAYALAAPTPAGPDRPTIVVRPRGWHLDERHLTVDSETGNAETAVGALVDFGLYFFHNAAELLSRGKGPYFYLPKLESHLEARLWNDVFTFAESYVGVPPGSIRATVLIETIPAAFEMEEILYELREHAAGLNAGRWDYLFSLIKNFRDCGDDFVLPDRATITMAAPFLRAYSDLLVKTCHRRGAFAIGGMAAFIPSRDPQVNAVALAKVREDKQREAGAGFDGSWVAHPALVPVCREIFDGVLGDAANQLGRQRDDVDVGAAELLDLRSIPRVVTEAGLRGNVEVSLRYLASWLTGNGAVAIHNLMEDAATAEISRSQIWQWVHNGVVLDDGRPVTAELVEGLLAEEAAAIRAEVGDDAWTGNGFASAQALFAAVALADDFADFLTLPAYALID
jgi:malate synthase